MQVCLDLFSLFSSPVNKVPFHNLIIIFFTGVIRASLGVALIMPVTMTKNEFAQQDKIA
jgi:hypothetical protein